MCSLNGFIDILGNEKIVKRLIEKGADVNAQTDELITPLGYAASGGNFEKTIVERNGNALNVIIENIE